MFGMGTQEVILILAIAVMVFGVKRLPELGRNLGLGITNFKKAFKEISREVEEDDDGKA